MDAELLRMIAHDRGIAYATVTPSLHILATGGALDVLHCEPPLADCAGAALVDMFPELIGSESALDDILRGELPRLEFALVNRDTPTGDTVYLTMVVLPDRDAQGEIRNLLFLVQDATTRGRMVQRLAQRRNELSLMRRELEIANVELQRLSDTKSRFVSIAAHELRSPLTTISGYLEMLLEGDLGDLADVQVEALRVVDASARRLLGITDELLDVARIESGRVELSLVPVDLAGLIRQVATELHPRIEAKSLTLSLPRPAAVPPALCDVTRSQQILGNLLSNAVKYTPHGGWIEVRLTSAEEEGFLEVVVADNGIGISPEDQGRLFIRFFRAESALQTDSAGAGLGLYITRALVTLHSGRIWLESELGKGATFHVTFPMA